MSINELIRQTSLARFMPDTWRGSVLALSAVTGLAASMPAAADEADARQLFQAMSDYLTSQDMVSFSYDAELDIITTEMQKVGIASSGKVSLDRPDKLHMSRTGGFADIELAYDGAAVTIFGKNLNVFTALPMSGSIDDMIEGLRSDHGFELPAADLLLSDVYSALMENVDEVMDFGSGVIGGEECDHLAFRTKTTDWQIWITGGDTPVPCKLSITSKMMALAPSYTLVFSDWAVGDDAARTDFQLATGDATEVQFHELEGASVIPDHFGKGDEQ